MHANATQQNAKAEDNGEAKTHRNRFTAVHDRRKRRVRGLWMRNGAYYQQMWVQGEKSPRRVRLTAATLEEAKREMEQTKQKRDDEELPARGRKPTFAAYADEYITLLETAAANQTRAGALHKSAGTIHKEKTNLAMWKRHLGENRLDQITRAKVAAVLEKRLADGSNPRTVNLDVIMLRNVLRRAHEAGLIRKLPTEGIRPLKCSPPKRDLLTPAELQSLFDHAQQLKRNGQQMYDFLRFLAYGGAREQDALRMEWADVDFQREELSLRIAKNQQTRTINFNPALGDLLGEMHARRAPDTSYLFPSPKRGEKDVPLRKFRASFNLVRKAAGLEWASFHDLRHYFASMCVMGGIDYMTVASWLGHQDGGILVGKVYGHLLDEHKKKAAQGLSFGLSVVKKEDAA